MRMHAPQTVIRLFAAKESLFKNKGLYAFWNVCSLKIFKIF